MLDFARTRPWMDAMGLGAFALLAAALAGLMGGIPLPVIHDEFAFLFMGETFARGRLTNPTPAFWEHLETFHVLMTPSYAGKYPPAQGLFLAVGFLLGHPVLGVWISSGFLVWAVTWMLQPWVGRKWAVAGGILTLLNLGIGSPWAQTYWGGAVAAGGGAMVFGAIRRGWGNPRWHSGVILGLGLLVLANSRPFEGLLVSIPALLAVVVLTVDTRRKVRRKLPMLLCLGAILAGGFSAMGLYNRAVTGSALQMPYQEYQEQYANAPNLLIGTPRDPPPTYRHQEFADFWATWVLDRFELMTTPRGFLWSRFRKTLDHIVLLGPAVLGLFFLRAYLKDPWTLFALSGAGLAFLGCMLTKEAYPHYLAPATAPLVALALLGGREIAERKEPSFRGRRVLRVAAVVACVVGGAHLYLFVRKQDPPAQRRRAEIVACLETLPFQSLVLVEYPGVLDLLGDWVRNPPDPWTSKVVWARSRGPAKDAPLIDAHPGRAIWRVPADQPALETEEREVRFDRFPEGMPASLSEREPACR